MHTQLTCKHLSAVRDIRQIISSQKNDTMARKDHIPRVYGLHSTVGPAIQRDRERIRNQFILHPIGLLQLDNCKRCI